MNGTRVFENRELRGTKGEVTGRWRKLRNQQLHNICLLPNVNYGE
jgi:hypothetical protein